MPVNGSDVKVVYYTRSAYNNLSTKDDNTIYYVQETNGRLSLYIGTRAMGYATEGYVDSEISDVVDYVNSSVGSKLDANSPITASTRTKITYDSKGLVTGGSDLVAGDIPNLPISKITNLQTSLNAKQDKLVAGDNITIDENNVISASGGGEYELTKSKIDTALVGADSESIQLGQGASAEGYYSTALGQNASASAYSTALGQNASASGEESTALGLDSSVQGNASTGLGYDTYIEGNASTAVGSYASAYGEASTALGSDATAYGNYSTALGTETEAEGDYSTAVGYGANTGNSNNTMRLGNTNLASLQSQVQLTVTSDIRDKADIEEVPKALDFIKDLNPITYVANDRDHYISEEQKKTDTYKDYLMVEDYDRESHSQGTKKGSRRRVGLSAQEVREKLIEHYGSDNYANVVNDNFVEFEERGLDIPEGLENKLSMSYETLVPFLIKAIKEQQEQIEELKKKINKE